MVARDEIGEKFFEVIDKDLEYDLISDITKVDRSEVSWVSTRFSLGYKGDDNFIELC